MMNWALVSLGSWLFLSNTFDLAQKNQTDKFWLHQDSKPEAAEWEARKIPLSFLLFQKLTLCFTYVGMALCFIKLFHGYARSHKLSCPAPFPTTLFQEGVKTSEHFLLVGNGNWTQAACAASEWDAQYCIPPLLRELEPLILKSPKKGSTFSELCGQASASVIMSLMHMKKRLRLASGGSYYDVTDSGKLARFEAKKMSYSMML